jgi:ketosteroid isomerase-like protein
MMNGRLARIAAVLVIASGVLTWGCTQVNRTHDPVNLEQEVVQIERAFARTMADRDHAAFTAFLSDEAIFFAGDEALRRKGAVAAAWMPFFEGAAAPFSWEPDRVEVLESGSLALSTGPVYDLAGNVTARFQSIWRRETDGEWRVVFDRGTPVCGTPPPS